MANFATGTGFAHMFNDTFLYASFLYLDSFDADESELILQMEPSFENTDDDVIVLDRPQAGVKVSKMK